MEKRLTASQVILQGLSKDGGLFVPEDIPAVDIKNIENIKGYKDIAFIILKKFLTDYSDEEIKSCIEKAYSINKFDNIDVTPIFILQEGCPVT
jgi:threonine synthase